MVSRLGNVFSKLGIDFLAKKQNYNLSSIMNMVMFLLLKHNYTLQLQLKYRRLGIKLDNNLVKGKGKVFSGQEPSTATECGFNYQLLAVIY